MRLISSFLNLFLIGNRLTKHDSPGNSLSKLIPVFPKMNTQPNPMAMSLDLPVTSPSYSLYKFIHTTIRGQLADFLIEAGKADYSDINQVSKLLESILKIQSFLTGHAAREDAFIQPMLQANAFSNMMALQKEHEHSNDALTNLVADLRTFKEEHSAINKLAQDKRGYQFYLNLAKFIAFYFDHMNTEEQEIMPFIRSVLTPDEIVAIYMASVASVSDKEVVDTISAIFPYVDCTQRVKLVKMLHADCAHLFEDIVGELNKCLEPEMVQLVFEQAGIHCVSNLDTEPSRTCTL